MSWAIANFIDRGLASARPAAGAVPDKHWGWFATDTGILSISDGSSWIDIGPTSGSVSSVFGRTGIVVAVAGDYFGVVPAALTGATQAGRLVGATTSGAPASGTFAVGDVAIARDGHLFMCISAGSPGTWVDTGGSVSFATPSIALGSTAAAGAASTAIRSDATIAAFDTTAPSTQAFGDSAAIGTAAFAPRRDHKHAMPATPVTTINKTGSTALTGAVTLTGGTNVTLTQSGQDISIAASASAGPGTEIGYDQITGNVTVSSATEATGTTIITCAAHTFDGSPVYCEFFAVAVGVFDLFLASLFEGSTQIGRICQLSQNTTALPASGAIRFTPSAGSHTFSVTAWRLSGNATVFAGAGGTAAYSPCFVRFTKV